VIPVDPDLQAEVGGAALDHAVRIDAVHGRGRERAGAADGGGTGGSCRRRQCRRHGCTVVGRHLVALAAFFVQPDSPALAVGEVVLEAKSSASRSPSMCSAAPTGDRISNFAMQENWTGDVPSGSRLCENSLRYKRTRNFEACGHAHSKKTQKFTLCSALRPNQIRFSHSLGQNPTTSFSASMSPSTSCGHCTHYEIPSVGASSTSGPTLNAKTKLRHADRRRAAPDRNEKRQRSRRRQHGASGSLHDRTSMVGRADLARPGLAIHFNSPDYSGTGTGQLLESEPRIAGVVLCR
jgi:hypothetical protein